MTQQTVTIEKATPERLREVLEILSQVDLPHDGVEEHISSFLVARSGGEIVGCVGLERHGEIGLLRSAAVLPQYQGQRIGGRLIRELLKRAPGEGTTEMALLTTTAKDYFESNFGFKESTRSLYEKRLQNSPEWNIPRCSSATFMTLKL
jgi:N-acetylglutamate synthase-like GNAT family acetyltransferase